MVMTRNKARFIAGFIIVSLIFIYLRAKTLDHLLMWDEARNIISLRAFLTDNYLDPFYRNYFLHPPLYMAFAALAFPFKAGLDMRLELLSLFFSYLTLFVVYVLSAKTGGWRYAFLSGFFLSLMPVSIGYDTWIKRDGLASCLGYLAILLLVKRKFLWCAIALSFSMLTKENALFFLLAATAVLFILKERMVLKKIALIYGIVIAFSVWWYLGFSSMPADLFDIYLSAQNNVSAWANSSTYYFKKLLPDLGLPMLIFFLMGLFYILYLFFRKKEYRWSLPLIIFLCVYVPSSFVIMSKTPWLSASAAPALAMIAAAGALFLLRRARRLKSLLFIFTLLLIFLAHNGLSFSYSAYHTKTYPGGWSGASNSRTLAFYLNNHMRGAERLMLTQFCYWGMPLCSMCPVFLYYYDGKPVYIIDGRDSAEEVMKEAVKNKISWLAVADSPESNFNFHTLVKGITGSVLGKPGKAGSSYVWNTDILWRQ